MPRVAFKCISSQQRSTRKLNCFFFFFLFLLVCFCWVGEEREPNNKKRRRKKKGSTDNSVSTSRKQLMQGFKWTNLQLNRKQSQANLRRNTTQSERMCQMSENREGCTALGVFFFFFFGGGAVNKGPLFPEAAGRNISHWLAQVPFLSATFSCVSWYHPSP